MPSVRRIDVKTPVPALREASTVLVDTPGLYSRMKFGYDLMTREFRDSAACAVFVVRSDNGKHNTQPTRGDAQCCRFYQVHGHFCWAWAC